MKLTYYNSRTAMYFVLTLFIGLLSSNLSYADDVPDKITHLSMSIGKDSVTVSPINFSKAKITGRIKEAKWGGHNRYLDTSRGAHSARWTKGSTRWDSYIPSRVKVYIPKKSIDLKIDVLTDGQFSAYLELKDGYYFSKDPSVNVKPGYVWWSSKTNIYFYPENPSKPGSFPEEFYVNLGYKDSYWRDVDSYKQKIKIFFIDVAKSLAKNLLTKVKVSFAEKNSRVPIKPDVLITMEDGPTFDSIKTEWGKKYDAEAVKKLVEVYLARIKKASVRVFEKGDVKEFNNQEVVEFWAFRGSSFKVETRDRNFYYFQGRFGSDGASTEKTVLLTEIGDKLRSDDEGHGGQIISN